ncbi:MAG TPA: adenylate/guanylate cyclase domain-containing protein [Frankiaceae bacterium]|nr:adenylate/guanylate cyclase domain-containing protein [Frankiaceae bacterium]
MTHPPHLPDDPARPGPAMTSPPEGRSAVERISTGASPEDASATTCPACGTSVLSHAQFCHACGVPLTTLRRSDGAERRVVTVLFGDLSDFTAWAEDLDPERVGEVTDRVLAGLARTVTDFDGHVDKLTGDGIMAVFGAPTAHEDDVERAVRAAAAMQETVRQLVADESGGGRRLGLRVGLNTGEVLAGVQAALAYTVVGDTVNTASRLSDAALVGGVYAGRETALATMAVASWRPLPPLRLKGKREPVQAYELVTLRPAVTNRLGLGEEVAFIGRDVELGRMIGTFVAVADGDRPQTLVITGEAGVGKTRAAQELSRFAQELPGARVLWGRATPYGENRHLAPLVDIVRTACGVVDGDAREVTIDRVRRTVERLDHPSSAWWAPTTLVDRLLTLLGLTPDSGHGPPSQSAPSDPVPRDGVLDGVAMLLRALAEEGPLLVVIDDMHWASDELRRAVVETAQRLRGPVLLTLVGREGLPSVSQPVQLALEPLEDDAADRLLSAFLGGADLDPRARDNLLGRARGNPYFLAELLHLLVDRGLLRRDGVRLTPVGSLPDEVLPAGVQAVLAARIDDLDPTARAVLRAAAVLGSRFPVDALAEVERRSESEVRAAVDELAARQLLRPAEGGSEASGRSGRAARAWAFVHPMARDVAYGSLPKAERARRHARAARWATASLEGTPAEVDAFLAAQSEAALGLAASMQLPATDPVWQVRELGLAALLRLGQSALVRDEYSSAADLLRRALAMGEGQQGGGIGPERQLQVRLSYAEALAALRRLDQAEDSLRPALGSSEDRTRLGALTVLGDIRYKQGRDADAVELLERVFAEATECGAAETAGVAVRQLGLVDYYGGRLKAAEHRFSQALEIAREKQDRRGSGWALQHLAWAATTRGDYAFADTCLHDATEHFAALEDTGGLAWCAGTESLVRLLQGRLKDARTVARGLVPLAETLAESWGVAICLLVDAMAAAELGDVSEAQKESTQAERLFRETGDTWGQSLALVAQGMAARSAGTPDIALERLHGAVHVAAEGRHPLPGLLALVNLGLAALEAGDLTLARSSAERASTALERLDLEPHVALGVAVLNAQAQRASGKPAEAVQVLRSALSGDPQQTLLFPRRQALAHLAGSLLDDGRPDEALEVARRAVWVPAEDVRSRVLALRALGTALRTVGDAAGARRSYTEALVIARETEARSEEPITADLLQQLS